MIRKLNPILKPLAANKEITSLLNNNFVKSIQRKYSDEQNSYFNQEADIIHKNEYGMDSFVYWNIIINLLTQIKNINGNVNLNYITNNRYLQNILISNLRSQLEIGLKRGESSTLTEQVKNIFKNKDSFQSADIENILLVLSQQVKKKIILSVG